MSLECLDQIVGRQQLEAFHDLSFAVFLRCSHRAAETYTTQPSSGKTGRRTFVKRGTEDSHRSSTTTTHPFGKSSTTTTHPSGQSSANFAKRASRPRPPSSKMHLISLQKASKAFDERPQGATDKPVSCPSWWHENDARTPTWRSSHYSFFVTELKLQWIVQLVIVLCL